MWKYDDGGREEAGYSVKNDAGDCVVRAIAIAGDLDYAEVYRAIADHSAAAGGRRSGRDGVANKVYRSLLEEWGWPWTPTMHIGSGCQVHLTPDELPPGRLVARLSGHLTAVVDGIVHDTFDPSREGTRCVYGYWTAPDAT